MPQRIDLTWLHDISASLETHDFVSGLLGNGTASVIYGEPNCGKTFFALELGLSVARGIQFFGREVTQGGVIYCALEGGYGVRNRIAAYVKHHRILPEDAARIPFAIVTTTINLMDAEGDTNSLIHAILDAADRIDEPVRLVIIDTLSRAMPGGNENSPEHMTALISNVDHIRVKTSAHALLVHHCGKDTAKGMRGHSSLRGAIDTEIEVTKQPNGTGTMSVAKVLKQRDFELAGEFTFKLHPVELGHNDRDEPVTSCIVEEYEPEVMPSGPKIRQSSLRPSAHLALKCLQSAMAKNGEPAPASNNIPSNVHVVKKDIWRDEYRARQIGDTKVASKDKSFKRGFEDLAKAGVVGSWMDFVWLTRLS